LNNQTIKQFAIKIAGRPHPISWDDFSTYYL